MAEAKQCPKCGGGHTSEQVYCPRCRGEYAETIKTRRAALVAEGRCGQCGGPHEGGQTLCNKCLRQWRQSNQKPLYQCIEAYGGACTCCGEQQVEFLRLVPNAEDVPPCRSPAKYRSLIQREFPAIYHVLCANCELALSVYGVCPHHPEREAVPPRRRKPRRGK